MFKWFKNKILEVKEEVKESRRNYRLEFLKNLTTKEQCKKIRYELSLGYLHVFSIYYPNFEIKLEYNDIRDSWDIEIWSYETNSFIFYYDCLDRRPVEAIQFMLDKHNIWDKLDKKLKEKEEREKVEYNKKQEVLNKYLNHE